MRKIKNSLLVLLLIFFTTVSAQEVKTEPMYVNVSSMHDTVARLTPIIKKIAKQNRKDPYCEFMVVPDLSVGIYYLPIGGKDYQHPHAEDEVYYIYSGKAKLRAGNKTYAVAPGSLAYVKKSIPHHFFAVTSPLVVLVFFAPGYSGAYHAKEKEIVQYCGKTPV